MSNSNPYKQFERKVFQCLTVSEDEFYRIIPSKYKGKDVAKVLYKHYTNELENRKKTCHSLIHSLKMMKRKNEDFGAFSVESKMELMKTLKKAANKSIAQMEEEMERRNGVIQKIKANMEQETNIDSGLANSVIKKFNSLSKKM